MPPAELVVVEACHGLPHAHGVEVCHLDVVVDRRRRAERALGVVLDRRRRVRKGSVVVDARHAAVVVNRAPLALGDPRFDRGRLFNIRRPRRGLAEEVARHAQVGAHDREEQHRRETDATNLRGTRHQYAVSAALRDAARSRPVLKAPQIIPHELRRRARRSSK